ncbi:MAG: riboflavin synthase, partial [Pseudomonadota bacterium]
MFTGIVREIGILQKIDQSGDTKIRIGCKRRPESIEIGASISCSGVCLTVVALGSDENGTWFEVDASAETRAKTTLASWQPGGRVNLEPALRLGDELVESVGMVWTEVSSWASTTFSFPSRL